MENPASGAASAAASHPLAIPVIETERLLIRPLEPRDLEDCHRLFTAAGWSSDQDLERRRSWLDWSIASARELARLDQPPYGDRAVVMKDGGSLVGLVGLVPSLGPFAQLPCFGRQPYARFSPEAGLFWALKPSAQGRGFATEAARAFMERLFQVLNLARIIATSRRDNARSIAVMRRLGMRIEANPFGTPDWFQVVGIREA